MASVLLARARGPTWRNLYPMSQNFVRSVTQPKLPTCLPFHRVRCMSGIALDTPLSLKAMCTPPPKEDISRAVDTLSMLPESILRVCTRRYCDLYSSMVLTPTEQGLGVPNVPVMLGDGIGGHFFPEVSNPEEIQRSLRAVVDYLVSIDLLPWDITPELVSQMRSRNISDPWAKDVIDQLHQHVLQPTISSTTEHRTTWNNDRALFTAQRELEWRVVYDAINRYKAICEQLKDIKRVSNLPAPTRLLQSWYNPLVKAIHHEQEACARRDPGLDRNNYGDLLLLLAPENLAAIVLHEMMGLALVEPAGVTLAHVALNVGKAVNREVNMNQLKKVDPKLAAQVKDSMSRKNNSLRHSVREVLNRKDWPTHTLMKVGSALLQQLIDTATLEENGHLVPAFEHTYTFRGLKRIGLIACHPRVSRILETNGGFGAPRHLPMLVRPRPWTSFDEGGYLKVRSHIMRTRNSRLQSEVLKYSSMPLVYEGLNSLSDTPWKMNKPVVDVMQRIWNAGGGVGEVPSTSDVPLPPYPMGCSDMSDVAKLPLAEQTAYRRQVARTKHKNRDLHSLRCDFKLKTKVAQQFLGHSKFYFPYNLDFRGRAYPIPPNLNHLGADSCRGLLLFAEGKPLGPKGLWWMKVHLANLFGMDKLSFEGRVTWVDEKIDEIMDSADRPLEGSRFWLSADDVFQALATCIEITNAIRSGDPENFVSHLPIHQDGSCNGLQHYAALGKDLLGGSQVNLTPSEKPQDVYLGVCDLVRAQVEKDADAGVELAIKLRGHVTRRVVKQTVMTSVYGVTFIGARKQIEGQLKDRLPDAEETELYRMAVYLARLTLNSLGELFEGARQIMDWLALCARLIAQKQQPVCWVTPLGLPVVQPYRKADSYSVHTVMQTIILAPEGDQLPVHSNRQRSAFPPNYVHSLDSTHMLMTAVECKKQNVTFAAVHDSFWTHASTIELMNKVLREQFIHLHSQPLLEELRESFVQRFPDVDFPPLPKGGQLDLNQVMNSHYFFD
eukprot:GILK01005103.1.p1 GENE.GILK01005103.1~~GILK01005103.1.p1  ORF type:complete len:1028 (-),score=159.11 GILK01005103.1:222-3236(-)